MLRGRDFEMILDDDDNRVKGDRPRTVAERIQDWKDDAAKVPAAKRAKIMELLTTGSSVGQARVAVDLPLMTVMQIIIEEFPKIERTVCESLSKTKQS